MKKFFIFVPVQTMKKKFMLVPVQQYKHHVRSIALGSAVGLKVSARCSDAIRCISCELQLFCCIADVRTWGFFKYHIMFRVVPAAHAKPHAQQQIARVLEVDYAKFLTNVRGPPDKYGLLTLGCPCVR